MVFIRGFPQAAAKSVPPGGRNFGAVFETQGSQNRGPKSLSGVRSVAVVELYARSCPERQISVEDQHQ
jgi:hypothetical protein